MQSIGLKFINRKSSKFAKFLNLFILNEKHNKNIFNFRHFVKKTNLKNAIHCVLKKLHKAIYRNTKVYKKDCLGGWYRPSSQEISIFFSLILFSSIQCTAFLYHLKNNGWTMRLIVHNLLDLLSWMCENTLFDWKEMEVMDYKGKVRISFKIVK